MQNMLDLPHTTSLPTPSVYPLTGTSELPNPIRTSPAAIFRLSVQNQ